MINYFNTKIISEPCHTSNTKGKEICKTMGSLIILVEKIDESDKPCAYACSSTREHILNIEDSRPIVKKEYATNLTLREDML